MDASMTQPGFDSIAVQTLDELLTAMLERLVRAYDREPVAGIFDPLALGHGSESHRPGGGPSSMR